MQTDTATTTTNAVITNTASNSQVALSVLMHVLASLEALLVLALELVLKQEQESSVRTGVTMFTVVVSTCDSPSSASTVYSPVKASEVLKLTLNTCDSS